jgi:hypothetical protein
MSNDTVETSIKNHIYQSITPREMVIYSDGMTGNQ